MNWSERARAEDEMRCESGSGFPCLTVDLFTDGARWQREQLRTPEAIERTAETLWSTSDKRMGEDWAHEDSEIRKYFIDSVEEFSTALLGED